MCAGLDDSGTGLLRVPGFGGIPLDYELGVGKRFAHGVADWYRNPRLTKCEVSMLRFMQHVTEQPGWDDIIYSDPTVITKWEHESLTKFGLSSRAWDWCLSEIRDKAVESKRNNFTKVLDVDSPVVKSDTLIPASLLGCLQKRLNELPKEPSRSLGEPGSSTLITDIVDPSMYPLVYGQSSVLLDGGINWLDSDAQHVSASSGPAPSPDKVTITRSEDALGRQNVKPFFWSNRFQWLPCEVELSPNLEKVHITSYINNVHPEHKDTYQAIEGLIAAAIQPWNEVLILGKQGRVPMRIRTYDVPRLHADEKFWDGGEVPNLHQTKRCSFTDEKWDQICLKAKNYLLLPEYPREHRVEDQVPDQFPQDILGSMTFDQWNSPSQLAKALDEKYLRRYIYELSEPGVSFSYNDWKIGKNTGQPIHGKVDVSYPDEPFDPEPDHEYYAVNLRDFGDIQVIIKVSSIDLSPDNPSYAGDTAYQVSGLLNEHIVASAVCYYDVDNIESPCLSFQQEAHIEDGEFNIKEAWAIEREWDIPPYNYVRNESPPDALQELGSIPIPCSGRFIAWSNTLRYKLGSFGLKNPSRAGHLRYITLWLVDPHYRICSTRNVPPQQHTWWSQAALQASKLSESFPAELVEMIKERTESWPMSADKAIEVRDQTVAERDAALEQLRGYLGTKQYTFWDTRVILGVFS